MMGPLVAGFVRNLPRRVDSIHRAQLRSDWREVASQAHQMSGAAGGYGFPQLGRIAARMEAEAKDKPDSVDLARTIIAFGALCKSVVNAH